MAQRCARRFLCVIYAQADIRDGDFTGTGTNVSVPEEKCTEHLGSLIMSILILRGPDAANPKSRPPLSQALHADIVTSLVDRSVCAGKALAIRSCGSALELVDALSELQHEPLEILLVDAGTAIGAGQVSDALRQLRVPFIEIHNDSSAQWEAELQDPPANRIAVVHGFKAQSYTLAMSMALEHLGCADCESTFHVGT